MKRIVENLSSGLTDSSGVPVSYGSVYSYANGTSTLTALYKDWDLTIPHENPLKLDSAGKINAYVDARVDVTVYDADGTELYTLYDLGTGISDVTPDISAISAGNGVTVEETEVAVSFDDVTINTSSGLVQVKDSGVTTDKMVDGDIERDKLADVNSNTASVSAASGTASSFTAISGASKSVTVTGRPVFIFFNEDFVTLGSSSFQSGLGTRADDDDFQIRIKRDSTVIGTVILGGSQSNSLMHHSPSKVCVIDVPSAGTYTYSAEYISTNGESEAYAIVSKFYVVEL